jgi:hypothetical protein
LYLRQSNSRIEKITRGSSINIIRRMKSRIVRLVEHVARTEGCGEICTKYHSENMKGTERLGELNVDGGVLL